MVDTNHIEMTVEQTKNEGYFLARPKPSWDVNDKGEYEAQAKQEMQSKMQEECQEWLTFLSFKIHHLIRTHKIEGIYSKHATFQYSSIEKHLKNLTFTSYMNSRHESKKSQQLLKPPQDYLFKGRMRECEEVWLHRNNLRGHSLATGEFGLDKKEHEKQQKIKDTFSYLHDKPMVFGPVRYNDADSKLNQSIYQCPPLHRSVK